MTKHGDLLEFAITYANNGLSVFPCSGKRPITRSGFLDSSADLGQIREWWTKYPKASIGIRIPDDIVVVDCDSASAKTSLEEMGLILPDTLSSKGSRGKHYWYKRSPSGGARRRIGIIDKVDILLNGYVIAPPSVHSSGKVYEWEGAFDLSSIVQAPQWIETISFQEGKERDRVEPHKILSGIPEGQRQVGLFRYACYLRANPKCTREEAQILVAEAARRCGFNENTDKLVARVWEKYQANEEEEIPPKRIWTLAEMRASDIERPVHLVDNLIPNGLTIISSNPKVGKSAMMCQVAYSISTGTPLFGTHNANKTGVLYLDLEQELEPSYERWRKLIGDKEWPDNLYVSFEWEPIDRGGYSEIESFLSEHPSVGLVVIDTMADVWPSESPSSENIYHREQKVMRQFKKISTDWGVSVVLVHHNRKEGAMDMISRASGSHAITGKAHGVWSLSRKRGSPKGLLEISGKNIPEAVLKMRYDIMRMRWEIEDGPPVREQGSGGNDSASEHGGSDNSEEFDF